MSAINARFCVVSCASFEWCTPTYGHSGWSWTTSQCFWLHVLYSRKADLWVISAARRTDTSFHPARSQFQFQQAMKKKERKCQDRILYSILIPDCQLLRACSEDQGQVQILQEDTWVNLKECVWVCLLLVCRKASHANSGSADLLFLLLDFSDALDGRNPDLLSSCLSDIGNTDPSLAWFRSYLSLTDIILLPVANRNLSLLLFLKAFPGDRFLAFATSLFKCNPWVKSYVITSSVFTEALKLGQSKPHPYQGLLLLHVFVI